MAGFTIMLVMDEGFKIIGEWRAEAMKKELTAQACRKKDEDTNIAMEQEDEASDTQPNEDDSLVDGVKKDNPSVVVDDASYQLESALITTIAIGLHSLIEGVAMAASMYLSTTGQNM
jgi:zinc transporter ZupT